MDELMSELGELDEWVKRKSWINERIGWIGTVSKLDELNELTGRVGWVSQLDELDE
jgi:hypothetical protein